MNWPRSRRSAVPAPVAAPAAAPPEPALAQLARFFSLPGPTPPELVKDQVAKLAQAGALDAANGDVVDGWLEGLRRSLHAQHAAERTAQVAAVEREIRGLEAEERTAQRRADIAADDARRTERHLDVVERDILEPAEARAGDKWERRRRPRPTRNSLEGLERRWWDGALLKLFVVMAAVGDVVTFNVTLQGFFRDSGLVILWLLTLALAAASVGLMHTAGQALKDLREGRGGHGRLAIGFLLTGWVVLGAVTVAFRIMVSTPQTAAESAFGADTAAAAAEAAHDAFLSAILLGGLFIASGFLAFYAGFAEHHPRMKTYRVLRKRLPQQQEQATELAHRAETLRRELEEAHAELARVPQRTDDAIAATNAMIDELKEFVRVQISEHLGMPEATTGLIAGRHGGGGDGADDGRGIAASHIGTSKPGGWGASAASRVGSPAPLGPGASISGTTGLWGDRGTTPGDAGSNGHGALNGHVNGSH